MSLLMASSAASAQTAAVPVTVDTYSRAQTDVNFAGVVKAGGFGQFKHGRELAAPVQQGIVRPNRDTPLFLRDPRPRRRAGDGHAAGCRPALHGHAGRQRGPVHPGRPSTTPAAAPDPGGGRHALRHRRGPLPGRFREPGRCRPSPCAAGQGHARPRTVPAASRSRTGTRPASRTIQAALQQLGTTVSDTRRMFGAGPDAVDPVRHLIGSAMLWGGYPEADALYLPTTPARNDGNTIHRLTVGEVPVDGFWSLTVYNSAGYLQENPENVYSVNSLTARKGRDGAVTIQFGGCDGRVDELPADHAGMELHRPPVPPAGRDPRRQLDLSRGPAGGPLRDHAAAPIAFEMPPQQPGVAAVGLQPDVQQVAQHRHGAERRRRARRCRPSAPAPGSARRGAGPAGSARRRPARRRRRPAPAPARSRHRARSASPAAAGASANPAAWQGGPGDPVRRRGPRRVPGGFGRDEMGPGRADVEQARPPSAPPRHCRGGSRETAWKCAGVSRLAVVPRTGAQRTF